MMAICKGGSTIPQRVREKPAWQADDANPRKKDALISQKIRSV